MKSRNGAIFVLLLVISLLVMSCSAGAEAQAETAEPVVVEEYVPTVSVTGVVVPARWASLSVNGSGVVEELAVAEGVEVEEGEILLQLSGKEQLEAAITAANLELIGAEQNLQDVYDNSELMTSEAQFTMADAVDNLDDTEYHWQVQQEGYRADGEIIARAEANLVLAQIRLIVLPVLTIVIRGGRMMIRVRRWLERIWRMRAFSETASSGI